MTKEQRVLNIINRKAVDYLPSQISFSDRSRDDEICKELGLKDVNELDEYMSNHIRFTFSADDLPIIYRNDDAKMEEIESKGFCGIDHEKEIVYDRWGAGIKMHEDGFFVAYHPLQMNQEKNERAKQFLPPNFNKEVLSMNNLEDAIRNWEPPEVDSKDNFLMAEKELNENNGNFLMMVSGYGGIYERGYHVLGWEELMVEMAAQPEMIEEYLDKVTEYKIRVAQKCVDMGVKVGHTGDDLGTQVAAFFSKDMFRRMLKPRYAKLFDVYKKAGIPVWMHSCGYITELIPDLIDIGLDVLEPVQPCMDLHFLKKEFGQDLVFYGGIDTQHVLPFGTPAEVKQMARDAIYALGKGGGLIIAPSQEITKEVPTANVIALLETISEERERVLDM